MFRKILGHCCGCSYVTNSVERIVTICQVCFAGFRLSSKNGFVELGRMEHFFTSSMPCYHCTFGYPVFRVLCFSCACLFSVQPRCGRSMSVCVPHLSAVPSLSRISPSAPSTPPPVLSAPLSPSLLRTAPEETFAEKLSKALESVLPMHSAFQRKHRRSSLPSLFVSTVCNINFLTKLVTSEYIQASRILIQIK